MGYHKPWLKFHTYVSALAEFSDNGTSDISTETSVDVNLCDTCSSVTRDHTGCLIVMNLKINIDDVPLFKSSSCQLWPILCSFDDFHPFVVALFTGEAKPELCPYYVTIKTFLCGAPEQAMLKCIK